MSEEEGFLRALEDNPADEAALLVYADWLEERGDVRGEFLRLLLAPIPTRLRQLAAQLEPGWVAKVRRRWLRGKLFVLRGLQPGREYPLYEGDNLIGHPDEVPVDIDLTDQEPPDRVWASRQHAVIHCQDAAWTIEDLNSSNGTYLNRRRVYPGQRQALEAKDIIQIGSIQLRVEV
jgi:uncharacterized protein (TIGR02996 family)